MASLSDFLHYDFLAMGLAACLLVSLACGAISPLVVARKSAFMGSAVAHSTILGLSVALSFVTYDQWGAIYAITLGITLVLAMGLAWASYGGRVPPDSLIGVFFTVSMGAGILVHALFSKDKGDLMGLLFGNILLIGKEDLWLAGLLAAITSLSVFVPLRRWAYVTYDEQGALVSGLKVGFYHYFFYGLLTVLIVSSIKVAGTVLINTLLLVPGVFALKMATSLRGVFLASVSFSMASGVLGLVVANFLGLPSGATLTVVQFLLMVLILGTKRGIAAWRVSGG